MTRAVDPWIELHVGLVDHPKVIRLQRVLDMSRAEAIGHLVMLWLWALTYAPDGSLKRFTDVEIAHAARFDARSGTPEAFAQALSASGWIDRRPRKLHDWHLYAGKLLEQRARNASRMRDARAPHVSGNQTGPDSTEPDQTKSKNGVSRREEAEEIGGKYLARLQSASPSTFGSLSLDAMLEVAGDEGMDPLSAARMIGDVWEWWRTAPPSKRWRKPMRGWRTWCRRETEKRAAAASTNGHAPPPAQPPKYEGRCEECGMLLPAHVEDCPTLAVAP